MSMWFFRLHGDGNSPSQAPESRRSSSQRSSVSEPIVASPFFYPASTSSVTSSARLLVPRGSNECPHFAAAYGTTGLVPPLHRKMFKTGAINPAESLDNVAQLIPRYAPHPFPFASFSSLNVLCEEKVQFLFVWALQLVSFFATSLFACSCKKDFY